MKSCPSCNRTYPDDTLAFCLVDGSVLSAPYDSEQTQRIPAPRQTSPAPTELFNAKPAGRARPPLQSTIHAPAPAVPSSRAQLEAIANERRHRSLLPWLLVSGAIVIVGVFAILIIAFRPSADENSARRRPSPEPRSTVGPKLGTMCGQTVTAPTLEKWDRLGGETGKLGCPINQQTEAPASSQGTTGQWIQFAKGDGGYLIEWTPAKRDGKAINASPSQLAREVYEVSGCMFKLYASVGGTKSWLGFPVSDGRETPTGARQDFEDGYIVWDSKTYNCQAYRNQ